MRSRRAGYDIYCAAERVTDVAARLFGAGARDITADAWDTLRIEAGLPLFGVDMDTDTIPLEAGIEDRAISQTKGCYVGQEVVIRVLHRGGGRVVRRLVAWTADAESPPRQCAGARHAGRARRQGHRPRHQRGVVAVAAAADRARLRPSRSTEPGTKLTVGVDPPVAATVATLPLVAMPVTSGATPAGA